ncbi:hypothetical protein I302_107109 [Kwoniella bestiolae CBS 10118]|uniref:Uncharacterized protein n=1 Tax=Kwoniella bestiolae CBS 10118 TaxID=1296100 RepID=A0A1B9FZH2_9TREE|nr:hypothetical protein I302_05626 [Kwoniella bestiolae CBS 10118]OCF24167.1 hypothetical protein I302_05626 [Kwoniella bestiolae CBS 10118]
MLLDAYLPFILLFIPLISAQPTPTRPPTQPLTSIMQSTTSPIIHPTEHINSPSDVRFQTHQTGNINRVETGAGIDDHLWMSGVLHTVEKAVQKQDEDSLLKPETSLPAGDKLEEGKKVFEGGRTVVMDSSRSRRRRRRRVHP